MIVIVSKNRQELSYLGDGRSAAELNPVILIKSFYKIAYKYVLN